MQKKIEENKVPYFLEDCITALHHSLPHPPSDLFLLTPSSVNSPYTDLFAKWCKIIFVFS